ncbi:MAG: hypothetical protein DHS20C11_07180 [Lysobacteraceae bacterium]|nr:MAG: hypothetical protein DHS20C11_07180 [Xanthomonadaceae bacterium]
MIDTLTTLAHFHYWLGYISHDEYVERVQVALWLFDEGGSISDPRTDGTGEEAAETSRHRAGTHPTQKPKQS